MPRRLVDIYSGGQAVEIRRAGGQWWPGRVVGRDHPGLWVQTGDGARWFVTNGGRIRPELVEPGEPAKPDR